MPNCIVKWALYAPKGPGMHIKPGYCDYEVWLASSKSGLPRPHPISRLQSCLYRCVQNAWSKRQPHWRKTMEALFEPWVFAFAHWKDLVEKSCKIAQGCPAWTAQVNAVIVSQRKMEEMALTHIPWIEVHTSGFDHETVVGWRTTETRRLMKKLWTTTCGNCSVSTSASSTLHRLKGGDGGRS